MSNTPAAAARVSDNVKHSEAQEYRFWGAVGTIGAVVAGVAVAAGLGVLEVGSFGLATPLVVAGGVLLAGGMTAVLSGQVADVAADAGRKVMGPDEGPIVTGISSILIGPEKHAAAHLGSWASCNRHKHGGASTMQYAKDIAEDVFGGLIKDVVSLDTGSLLGGGQFNPAADWNQGVKDADKEHNDLEQIVQGSSSVFFGRGRYHAARVGDKGTCGFIVGQGCETVIIGGETVTEGEIGTGDDPDKYITDLMKEWGGKAALAGIVLITLPLGIAAMADVALDIYIFSQVQGAIDEHIKDPEMRHKVDLAITVLTLGYGASKAHGGAPGEGGAAKDSEGAGSGGAAGEPVGESGRGPADGGATAPAEAPAAEQPTRAGRSENSPAEGAPPPENPVNQIGDKPGGSEGTAPPDQAGGEAGGSKAAETPGAAGSEDPVVQQGESPGGLRAADESGDRPDLTPEENFPGQQKGNNCAPQSCQQVIRQATGIDYSEAEMADRAQQTGMYDPARGTTVGGEADILNASGVPAHTEAPTPENIQKALDSGQGVITGHRAGALWEGDPNYTADPNYPMDNVGHAVHTTGLVRDANGNVTHYVINDTGTGTSGRMVPADQFHSSLDGYDAVMTDAPIRTPAEPRPAGLPTDDAPASGEATGAPRDAASRGDPATEGGGSAPEERTLGEEAKPADAPEAEASGEDLPGKVTSGKDAQTAGDGDPTVQTGDRPGGLKGGEDEDSSATETNPDATSNRGARARRTIPDDTMDQWARDYADNINSNRMWTWAEHMDDQIPASMKGAIKQRAVDQGLIPDIPMLPSTARYDFADFRGHILQEIQMPEYVTKPDGTTMNLWKATDDVQFRWLNDQVRLTDPDYTNQGDADATWHHHEGGGIDEGDNGSGRPDGTMQLVERGIHNATTHSGGRSDGLWAEGPR